MVRRNADSRIHRKGHEARPWTRWKSQRVRQIYELYLEYQSLLATVTELNRRGWTTKRWTTKKGTQRGGKLFTKNSLYSLLTNVTYVGKIKYKDEVHNGEHEAIVADELFQRAQTLLQRNGHTGGPGRSQQAWCLVTRPAPLRSLRLCDVPHLYVEG